MFFMCSLVAALKGTAELIASAEAVLPAARYQSIGAAKAGRATPVVEELYSPPRHAGTNDTRIAFSCQNPASRRELVPQGVEKAEFTPGNIMASEGVDLQDLRARGRRGARPDKLLPRRHAGANLTPSARPYRSCATQSWGSTSRLEGACDAGVSKSMP
jgi:hypothetical protein